MLLYYKLEQDPVVTLIKRLQGGSLKKEKKKRKRLCEEVFTKLLEKGEELGLSGNLWQGYLSYLLAIDENAWSLACERGEVSESLQKCALSDLSYIASLFFAELSVLCAHEPMTVMVTDYVNRKAGKTTNPVQKLAKNLKKAGKDSTGEQFAKALFSHYTSYGVGQFGLYQAFRVRVSKRGKTKLVPIPETDEVRFSDLVGYEKQKEKLCQNTEAFVNRRAANNCLLFGPAGTGKSSSIKALLTKYGDQGLRMIELYKHELFALPGLLELVRGRNYRFIIFMDDLSFEDSETDYKYLKAVIEGGLAKKPDNVLIYATSNRRHLIRESFTDREEGENDLHKNDTVQEKLSLAYRFGITIYFGSPNQKEFQQIVRALAERYKIGLPETELFLEANRFELTHGGLSGRTAQAFIDYLRGTGRVQG